MRSEPRNVGVQTNLYKSVRFLVFQLSLQNFCTVHQLECGSNMQHVSLAGGGGGGFCIARTG